MQSKTTEISSRRFFGGVKGAPSLRKKNSPKKGIPLSKTARAIAISREPKDTLQLALDFANAIGVEIDTRRVCTKIRGSVR